MVFVFIWNIIEIIKYTGGDKIKDYQKEIILPTCVIFILILLWEGFVHLANIPLYVLPAPSRVIMTFLQEFPILYDHALITLWETFVGIIIATVLAILLAIVMDAFNLFRMAIYPILVVSQTVPIIILAPLFIIYLGFGMAPKILTVVLMCFFPITISFADGMAQIDNNQINLVRSFGAKWYQVYSIVKIPGAMISLFSGLRVAATYSVTGAVVGEWLSSNKGLGYYMLRAKNGFMMDKVFACILAIVFLSLFMNGIVKLFEYLFLPHMRNQKKY
ncbi:MAG: ABC transporter permease [Clostridiales bacterium]|nr:ABC transporter permease [Clostridiales bacterium]